MSSVQKKPKFQESPAYEFMTQATRIPRPYTSSDFIKEYFIPNPDQLGKQR